jgi:hypothetical protein
MAAGIRPQAEFLRRNAGLLNNTKPRRDVVVFLPFRKWLGTSQCRVSSLCATLTRANVQYGVICEDDLQLKSLRGAQALLVDSLADLTGAEGKVLARFRAAGGTVVTAEKEDWIEQLQLATTRPSVLVQGSSAVRAVVQDQRNRTVVHLYNLGVQRLSSFEDKVTMVQNLNLAVRVPFQHVRFVRALTAEADSTAGRLEFSTTVAGGQALVEISLPHLAVEAILVFE